MRTLPRWVIILLAAVLVGLVALNLYAGFSSSPTSTTWISADEYPLQLNGSLGVVGQSCIDSAGYVYCIGGENTNNTPTSSIYYTPASATGVGNWTLSANPYPQPIDFESCVASSGYAYCVGGSHDYAGDDTAATYYAPLLPTGVGPWNATTSYPVPIDALACSAASGEIYCVGGENQTEGTSATTAITSSVWYAPLSSSGIGGWSRAADYPAGYYFPACTSLGSYVYCVGGENASEDPVNATYYSYVSSSGMGAWTAGPAFPVPTIAESCTTSFSSVYCVGGLQSGGATASAVYFSDVSSTGMGPWETAPSYPAEVATDCVGNAGFVLCVGGYDSSSGATAASYFALLNGSTSSSS